MSLYVEFETACAADEETTTEIEEEGKAFITKETSLGFRELNSFLTRFEKIDPDRERFLKVQQMVECSVACYRQIYEEINRAVIQTSLDGFLKNVNQPSTSIHVTNISDDDTC
ncbi:hypothetical protein QE152_g30453 [Popillia japonica]|uniref:Uncharacterized protein n=1 Tax=Popillia japonica TaxID=7064 RepID=A0AAW1JE78_POPJA